METNDLVLFRDVSLGYGRVTVLQNVDLRIQAGDFLGIVGPNGCGKTTLLRVLTGLIPARSGSVSYPRGRPRIGYVPQRQEVDPIFPLSAEDVVKMALFPELGPFSSLSRQQKERVQRALRTAGVTDFSGRLFRELSGGQKQRVLIARALVTDPELLVVDEPTNDMDIAGENVVLELLARMHERDRRTIVMVSHRLQVVCNAVRQLALIGNKTVISGPLQEILNADRLSAIYGIPFQVTTVAGFPVVRTVRVEEEADRV